MKKTKDFLAILLLATFLTLTGCGKVISHSETNSSVSESIASSQSQAIDTDVNEQIKKIYDLYRADGGELTYDEWLASIKGEKGDTGAQGQKGEQGEPGKDGKDGINGQDGRSPVVRIGDDGYWYIDGVNTGVKAQGVQGPKGDQGEPGKDGADGKTGPQGEKGASLFTYSGEPNSYVDGSEEDVYIDIDTWNYYVMIDGEWELCGNIKGETGAQGPQGPQGPHGENGASVLTGNGGPSSNLGNVHDSYIDLSSWDYYLKTQNGWAKQGNIKGETGIQGSKGDTGPQGPQGETGAQGNPGQDGRSVVSIVRTSTDDNVDTYTIYYSDETTSTFTVTNGIDGQNGSQGEQGIQGQPGADGHTPVITIAENGYWVVDGIFTSVKAQGPKGDTGAQGPKGDQGDTAWSNTILPSQHGYVYCEGSYLVGGTCYFRICSDDHYILDTFYVDDVDVTNDVLRSDLNHWWYGTSMIAGGHTARAIFKGEDVCIQWAIKDQWGDTYGFTHLEYGKTPEYDTSSLTLIKDGYKYTFSRWEPAVVPATEFTTYTAIYDVEQVEDLANYILNDDGQSYTYCNYGQNPLQETMVIPETYNSLPVTGIQCLPPCKNVYISKNIKTLYDITAESERTLENLYYDGTLSDWLAIDHWSLGNPSNNYNLFIDNERIRDLWIPDNVTEISECCFANVNLDSVHFGRLVESIGDYAFGDSNNIKSIYFNKRLANIGSYAFTSPELKYLELPDGLETVHDLSLCSNIEAIEVGKKCNDKVLRDIRIDKMSNLKELIVDEDNPYISVQNNLLLSNNGTKLEFVLPMNAMGVIDIPEGVVESSYDIFGKQILFNPEYDSYDYYEKMIIPSSLTNIGALNAIIETIEVDDANTNFMTAENGQILYYTNHDYADPIKYLWYVCPFLDGDLVIDESVHEVYGGALTNAESLNSITFTISTSLRSTLCNHISEVYFNGGDLNDFVNKAGGNLWDCHLNGQYLYINNVLVTDLDVEYDSEIFQQLSKCGSIEKITFENNTFSTYGWINQSNFGGWLNEVVIKNDNTISAFYLHTIMFELDATVAFDGTKEQFANALEDEQEYIDSLFDDDDYVSCLDGDYFLCSNHAGAHDGD